MLVANRSFAKSITAGKQYEFVRNYKDNIVIIDDNGFEVGYKKEFFEPIKKQTALEEIQERIKFEMQIIQMDMNNGVEYSMSVIKNQFKKLLEYSESIKDIEKEHIIQSYNKGREAGVGDYIDIEWGRNGTELTAEQYYNDTFGK